MAASVCNIAKLLAKLVEAPGIEPHDTNVPIVAKRCEDDADRATQDHLKRREVSASTARARRSVSTAPLDADEALRVAIVAAVYAAVMRRARALLDVLDAKPTTRAPAPAPTLL